MHWQQAYDYLCDAQMLLTRAVETIDVAHTSTTASEHRNIYLALEFDELFTSLGEIIETYQSDRFVNNSLCYRLQYFLLNTREAIAIAIGQPSEWLPAHYIFCKRLIYNFIWIFNSIEREKHRLRNKYGQRLEPAN